MKLEVLQENLSSALTSASRLVSTHVTLPILGNILLETSDGRLKISATNLETTITIFIGAKIIKDGSFTLPSRTFTELISTLPAGKISLELSEGQLLVSTAKFNSKINGIPAVEWPSPTEILVKGSPSLEIVSSDFVSAINQVAFAAATDDGRPVLTGVLFRFHGDNLSLVATDGFRLSQKVLAKAAGESAIVPAKALIEAARLVGEESKKSPDSKIVLSLVKNQIVFILGDIILSSRLIEGTFPAFEKIIPTSSGSLTVSVSSSELSRAIRSAGIFARDNANIIKFKISGSEGAQSHFKFQISSVAAQTGENESELDAKITGDTKEEFVIAFNYRYLLDFLSVVGDQEILIEFSSPLSPGLFKITGVKDFLHLIMPVRVQS